MPRVNSADKSSHVIYINHNSADGQKMISRAHRGEKWGRANYETGKHCVGLLDLSFLSGLVGDWFNCFQDPDNKIAGFFGNTFNAISGALFGKREEDMYSGIYGVGINEISEGKITNDDLQNQERILDKAPFMDDFLENAHFLQDRVINGIWRWTAKVSQLEPTIFLMSAFFGRKWSDIIFSGLQTFSRGAWRLAYFLPGAFHNNFVETAWDLSKSKVMSIFGSEKAKSDLKTLTEKLGTMANTYAEKVYEENPGSVLNGKTGLGAYLWMLKDRMVQHWRGVRNPEEVIREKINRGELTEVSEEERKADPSKSLEKGFVIPSLDSDKEAQKRASMVTFTAPACAALGLAGTFVFEPLKCVWDAIGLQKGRGILSFLALSRGPASLFNYLFKFFIPEKDAGLTYTNLEKDISDGTANEAVKRLYHTKKARLRNSYMGMFLLAASMMETGGQLFTSAITENRALKFIFTGLSRLVGVGFTRYFSARRRDLGETALIHKAAEIMLEKNTVTESEIKSISDNERFIEVLDSLGKSNEQEESTQGKRIYDPVFSWLSKKCTSLTAAIAG